METTTLAVDLAKDVFQVACANRAGRIHTRRRLTRGQFAELLATTPAGTEVVMDACGSAHYWARQAQAHGPAVRLLPVRYVRDDRKLQQGLLTQCPLCDPDLAHQHSADCPLRTARIMRRLNPPVKRPSETDAWAHGS